MTDTKEKIRLTNAKQVDTLGPGSYTAAPNLILRVKPTGSRSWIFRYQAGGKPKEIGLGKAGKGHCGLAEAREKADARREALRKGLDPASIGKPKHDPEAFTFKAYAGDLIKAREHEFTNAKHTKQWPSTLERYVYDIIGDKAPAEIKYGDIEAVLSQPELVGKRETASRVRQRIQVILDYASKREGEPHRYNPAASYKLPKRKANEAVKHHAAAAWQDVPAVTEQLRQKDSASAALLRFSILTAARSMEARGAVWSEFNLAERTWAIPAERMKARKAHRVWLCDEALAIIEAMAARKLATGERVFPGERGGLISDVAVNKTLRLAARDAGLDAHMTAHGFRSSFREWAAEATSYSREAVELCLAHTNPNAVERAYQRSDLFEARKDIMAAWGGFLANATAQSGDERKDASEAVARKAA